MFLSRAASCTKPPKIILLTGGPGSGKGYLASNIRGVQHVSMGQLIRNITKDNNHPKARAFKEKMAEGEFLNDNDISEVLNNTRFSEDQPVLLDGFPRVSSQLDILTSTLGKPHAIVHLEADAPLMKERLLHRGRQDDELPVINKRIADYFECTQPMVKKFFAVVPHSLKIDASNKPQDIAHIAQDFLQKNDLIAQYKPSTSPRFFLLPMPFLSSNQNNNSTSKPLQKC